MGDETAAYEDRIQQAVEGTSITAEEFRQKMLSFFKDNKKGDAEALRYFGLQRPAWRSDLEVLYPETTSLLRNLHQDYAIGIIANQVAGLEKRLENWSIHQWIDLCVSSAEVGMAKPDKRIFQLALERAGCSPRQACMIGDRLDNDIRPAKALGMKTV